MWSQDLLISLSGALAASDVTDSVHPAQAKMWQGTGAAELYERFTHHQVYQDILSFHMDLLGDLQGQDVLELGCGIGSATTLLASAVGLGGVVATDLSEDIVTYSRQVCSEHTNATFKVADAYGAVQQHASESDLVTAFNCIHLFSKLPHVLIAAYDQLPDGGRVSFCSGLTSDSTGMSSGKHYAHAIRAMKKELNGRGVNGDRPESSHPPLRRQAGYEILCRTAGFKVEAEMQVVAQPLDQIRDFLMLPQVLDDVLKCKVPDKDHERVVQAGIAKLEERGCEALERSWIHIVGTKCD